MKKILFITLIFLAALPNISGQENKGCEQFNKAFNYVEIKLLQKGFREVGQLQIDTVVQQCSGIPLMIDEYYAYQIGITENEFQETDTIIRNEIYRKNQKSLMKIDSIFSIDCFSFSNSKRSKLTLRFERINDQTISIWISEVKRKKKRHTSGEYLIFVFDNENQIKKVFETEWIE